MFSLGALGWALLALILAGAFIVWKFSHLTVKKIQDKTDGTFNGNPEITRVILAKIKSFANDPATPATDRDELKRLVEEEHREYAYAAIDNNGEIVGDVEISEKTDLNTPDSPAVDRLFRNGQPLIVKR